MIVVHRRRSTPCRLRVSGKHNEVPWRIGSNRVLQGCRQNGGSRLYIGDSITRIMDRVGKCGFPRLSVRVYIELFHLNPSSLQSSQKQGGSCCFGGCKTLHEYCTFHDPMKVSHELLYRTFCLG